MGMMPEGERVIAERECTHREHEGDRIVRVEVLKADLVRYLHGAGHAQDIFPYLSAADRELLFVSGICGTCWSAIFSQTEY